MSKLSSPPSRRLIDAVLFRQRERCAVIILVEREAIEVIAVDTAAAVRLAYVELRADLVREVAI